MPAILLTDALLRSTAPGEKLTELWDARVSGLSLRVSPGGVRSWTFRYRPKDSTSFKRLGLGKYPEVGLALARERAEKKRVEVSGGGDPQGARKAKREAERGALSFNAVADAYIERYAKPQKRAGERCSSCSGRMFDPSGGRNRRTRLRGPRPPSCSTRSRRLRRHPRTERKASSGRLFNWAIECGYLRSIRSPV